MLSDAVPVTPQYWNRKPKAYVKHQKLLVRLMDYFEKYGLQMELPPETRGYDLGRDLTVEGACVLDLKGFGLRDDLSWDSWYYEEKPNPLTYKGCLTDYFVHVTGDDVGEWVMGSATMLRADYLDTHPYYLPGGVITVATFTQCMLACAS